MSLPLRAFALGLAVWLCWHSASAQEPDPFDDEAQVTTRMTLVVDASPIEFACRKQAFYANNVAAIRACQGTDVALWAIEAQAFVSSAGEYLGAAEAKRIGACVPQPPATFTIEQNAVTTAEAELNAAKQQLAQTRADAPQLDVREAEVNTAQANLNEKKRILKKVALDAAKQKHTAWRQAVTKNRAPSSIYDFEKIAEGAVELPALDVSRVPQASSGASADQTRAAMCIELYQNRKKALDPQTVAQSESDIDTTAQRTHEVDTLRKTSAVPTIATAAVAGIENPGAPDYVIYSILSALGADDEKTGTQLTMTLNLSSLMWPDANDRLRQPAGYRNTFLRATFPLDVTEADAVAPEPPSDEPVTEEGVRRFSLVLGGSLFDENDTRTDGNRRCYEAALAYVDYGLTPESDLSADIERRAYLDVCNHVIVNRTRFAWRAGLGFVSEAGAGSESADTKPEMYAGVLIWAPTSQVYTNLLYQRYLRPRTVHTVGAGISIAGNAGGGMSGADGWARIGVDTAFLLSHDPDADETSWQLRMTPIVRGRLFGDGVASVGIGPVIRSEGDPALLATVSFGYDADRIMNELLTPLPHATPAPAAPP